MYVWMNGSYMHQSELLISPFDHGFLYGLGFFETFRTYEGKAIFLKEHYTRLQKALHAFRIRMPYSCEEINMIVQKLNELNGGSDGYFRLNVSAGNHEIGLGQTSYDKPNVIMFRKELPPYNSNNEKKALIVSTPRNLPEDGRNRFKSHHYGNNVYARFEIENLAKEEGIMLTKEGFVAEGITSNVFWVKDKVLYTPQLELGILSGITRENVIQLSKQYGIEVNEGVFYVESLLGADECFITTAVQQIVPIYSIGERSFPGVQGEITRLLQKAYHQLISQILKGEVNE